MTDPEKFERTEETGGGFSQDVRSKVIRAGKRTYFFDVKRTRNGEMYIIITESKKRMENDGNFFYEKHKIFLYPEDFDNFTSALEESAAFIREQQPEAGHRHDINDRVEFTPGYDEDEG
ncbi:MAG: DUF3276 family protein [Prolixibacteraceae bacterium]|jgi:hypothetical protein|nr:DUF3276 family protein [Prolixibacteraceae bacterium]HOY51870.1 DUF3276 family protein [Prolixibacteraceae bacterium]